MTAVAAPPNFQQISRPQWSGNGGPNGLTSMSAEDVSRIFMPRKAAQRTNSASSLSSTASSSSTVSASTVQGNGIPSLSPNDPLGWGARKKPNRSIFPPGKTEPIAGITPARPQSVPTTNNGPSATTAITALHLPSQPVTSQHMAQTQGQTNGIPRIPGQNELPAILHLLPMNGTFERKTITVPFFPDVLRIGRQTNNRTIPTPTNGYFDSKVLSRQHAEVWAERNGKIWIRDVKSSNGTFVNGHRLSQENKDSDPHELREQDMLELGIDIVSEDQKTVVHHKVAARVEHAGIYSSNNSVLDLNFGDLDPASGNSLMATPLGGQALGGLRGRTGSQGSLNGVGRLSAAASSAAGSNVNALGQSRHMAWLLNPVSVEQIVKRLTSELKQAKQQSEDLQRTGNYINAVLSSNDPRPEERSLPDTKPSFPIKALKQSVSFTDPPAPPPNQPLPEKPAVVSLPTSFDVGNLQRTNTEKVRPSSSSPTSPAESSQILSLVEALTSAKKEMEDQSVRLKDLEYLLEKERMARVDAEERARRAESRQGAHEPLSSSLPVDTAANGIDEDARSEISDAPTISPDTNYDTNRLQQRLDMMVAQMEEMQTQMEQHKRRAEDAEASSRKDRESLAEMVERIRTEEQDDQLSRVKTVTAPKPRPAQKLTQRGMIDDDPSDMGTSHLNGDIHPDGKLDHPVDFNSQDLLQHANIQQGKAIDAEQLERLERAISQTLQRHRSNFPGSRSLVTREQLSQASPYISMISVMIVGVSLMAYINSWQKTER